MALVSDSRLCLISHHKKIIPIDYTTHSWNVVQFSLQPLCNLFSTYKVLMKLWFPSFAFPYPSCWVNEWMNEWTKELLWGNFLCSVATWQNMTTHSPRIFICYIQVYWEYLNSANLNIKFLGRWKAFQLSDRFGSGRVIELPWWTQAAVTCWWVLVGHRQQFLQRRFWTESPRGLYHSLNLSSS